MVMDITNHAFTHGRARYFFFERKTSTTETGTPYEEIRRLRLRAQHWPRCGCELSVALYCHRASS